MATFTIDLLTGNLYLFSFSSSSGSGSTSGSTYPAVNLYTDLPSAGSAAGKIYLVRSGSGAYVVNRKDGGLYFSDGVNWNALPAVPPYFSSANFQVYDNLVNTKGIQFVTSGITSGFKKLKVQNSDGTIAYLTDLNTKLDTSVFNTYTGTTAPATFLTNATFNTYTGTTVPNTYYNKTQINSYSAATYILIGTKQNTLIAGSGISIVGNTISVTGNSSTSILQLLDVSGGTNINSISAIPIVWTTQEYSGTSLSFTGGSRAYVTANGLYGISYLINSVNTGGTVTNIGSVVRKNGLTDITPTSSSSVSIDSSNNSNTNTSPEYLVTLVNGDYVELMGFRIGSSGIVNTKANGSWLKIKKDS